MLRLTKNFRFEAAHRLGDGYEGKCANIHGHSWNGEIAVHVEGLDEFGMAIDFGQLKKVTKSIEDYYDHKIILNISDSELIDFCKRNGYAYETTTGNPTCELLCIEISEYILRLAQENPKLKVKKIEVTIKETCTTSCKIIKEV